MRTPTTSTTRNPIQSTEENVVPPIDTDASSRARSSAVQQSMTGLPNISIKEAIVSEELRALLKSAGLERTSTGSLAVLDAKAATATSELSASQQVYGTGETQLRPAAPPAVELTEAALNGASAFAANVDLAFNNFLLTQNSSAGSRVASDAIGVTTLGAGGNEPLSYNSLADLSADNLLAAFLKVNITDPNNNPEMHNKLHAIATNMRQLAIEEAKKKIENAQEAKREAEAYAKQAEYISTVVTVISVVSAVFTLGGSIAMFAAQQAMQQAAKQAIQQAVKQAVQEAVKNAVAAATKQAATQGLSQQATQQLVQQAVKQAVQDAVKNTMTEQFVQQVAQQLVQQGMQQGLTGQALQQAVQSSLQSALQQGVQQGVQQGLQLGIQQGVQQGMQQAMQQGVSQGLAQSVGQTVTQSAKSTAVDSVVNEAVRGISEQTISNISQRLVEESASQAMDAATNSGLKQVQHQLVKLSQNEALKNIGIAATFGGQVMEGGANYELAMKEADVAEFRNEAKRFEFVADLHQEQIEGQGQIMQEIMESKNSTVDAVLSMLNASFVSKQKLVAANMSR